jgi:hypothetical protein
MKKVVLYPDGKCQYINTAASKVINYESYSAWKHSVQYSSLIPVVDHYGNQIPAPDVMKKIAIDTSDILKARPNFLFGADPEGFVVDKNGKAVAPSFIPGTKEEPYKVDGGAIQRDGMAAEFNVDAANTFREWNSNFEKVLKALDGFLPKDHTMSWVPSVEFDPEVFDNAPDDFKELGCSPDWNAWEENLNPPPYCEDKPYLRTASGHIHIGWGENYSLDDALHQRNCFDFVKQLDWYLGGWSLKYDSNPLRRSLYGRAGACRLKSYGVEYRVLSNFWIVNESRRKSVWNRMQLAIRMMEERFMPERASSDFNSKLIEAINSGTMEDGFKKACRFPFQTVSTAQASF